MRKLGDCAVMTGILNFDVKMRNSVIVSLIIEEAEGPVKVRIGCVPFRKYERFLKELLLLYLGAECCRAALSLHVS